MKTLITSLRYALLIISITAFGCKKNHTDPTPSGSAPSQWTFYGHSYKATDVDYSIVNHTLAASDDDSVVGGGNYVSVVFGSVGVLSQSITLAVADGDAPANPSNCIVIVGNIYGTGYVSNGKAGDKVIVTVSPSGKLKASFSNITVVGPTDTKLVSGTIVEN